MNSKTIMQRGGEGRLSGVVPPMADAGTRIAGIRHSTGRLLTLGLLLLALLAPAFVRGADRYVSTNGTHTPPFINWISAATNLDAAVAWANTNNNGETVWVSNGTFWVSSPVIVSNTVVRSLSGIPSDTLVNGGSATRCFQLAHAGATLSGLTVTNGWAAGTTLSGNGGGVYLQSGLLTNCVVGGNSSANNGGGVYLLAGTVTACRVIGNLSTSLVYNYGGGGGVFMVAGRVTDCQVLNNMATNNGGGIFITTGVVQNCTISSNQSRGCANNASYTGGGGVYLSSGVISNCTIANNTDYTAGGETGAGGVYWGAPGATGSGGGGLYQCLIAGNSGSGRAGGAMIQNGNMIQCTLSANSCGGAGGLHVAGNATAPIMLDRCSIFESSGGYAGGGYSANGLVIFRNCLVARNRSSSGGGAGGILTYPSRLIQFQSCTIASNYAASYGGLYDYGLTNLLVTDTIVYSNLSGSGASYNNIYLGAVGNTSRFYNCCSTYVLATGQGNIPTAPNFVSVAGNNYRLSFGSPCINVGTNQDSWMPGAVDLDGHSRIDRFSGQVDIGAFEYLPSGAVFRVR